MYDYKQPINTNLCSWMTAEEAQRVRDMAGKRKLFAGKHREYFYQENRTLHEFQAVLPNAGKILYITENLPGRCSLKFADLLFGEELAVEPSGENADMTAAIARINEASSAHTVFYEAAVTASWAGKAHVQFIVDKGVVKFQALQPENVFPRYAPGTTTLVGAAIKFVVKINDKPYLRVIDHTFGKITHQLFALDREGKIGDAASLDLIEPGLAPEQLTGIMDLTVVEIDNYTAGGRGVSDYDGNESLIDEINNRRSQIAAVLDKHGNPAVLALEELFDENGNLKISGRAIKMTRTDQGDPVKYVTWEAHLSEATTALVDATNAFCGQMEMAPALLGLGGGTSADSWKKFKLQVSQTLARVNRKQLFLSPGIKGIYRIAFLLENHFGLLKYPVLPVMLTFSDGLPTDDLELMQIVTGYKEAGLMSLRRCLLWIHGDEKIVNEEIAALSEERQASLPTGVTEADLLHDPHEAITPSPDTAQPGTTATVADSILNGAQIQAAVQIVQGVADGSIPRDSGLGMVKIFFGLSDAQAAEVIGKAGLTAPKAPQSTISKNTPGVTTPE